jgi:hypothetical protein
MDCLALSIKTLWMLFEAQITNLLLSDVNTIVNVSYAYGQSTCFLTAQGVRGLSIFV